MHTKSEKWDYVITGKPYGITRMVIVGVIAAFFIVLTIDQLQPRLYGTFPNLFHFLGIAYALHALIRTEFEIDFICIINGLLRQILTDKRGQVSSHITAQGELTVRKCAGPGKTCGNMAVWPAVYAFFRRFFWAYALLNRTAFFNHCNFLRAALPQHFQSRKNTGWSCAYNHNIHIHILYLLPFGKKKNRLFLATAFPPRRISYSQP